MRILFGCEKSGIGREAFAKLGHDAWSCDLDQTDIPSKKHYVGDVRDLFNEDFDIFIVHPPCTRLANSGVRWLHERNLWKEMEESAKFFLQCLNAPFKKVCAENPIMHKYAREIIGEKYSQIVQPWQFGHGEQKATCLWLRNLPLLQHTNIVDGREQRIWKMPPGKNRAELRSRSYPGIARAMAEQWSGFLTTASSGHLQESPVVQGEFPSLK
jgi:hypothetical protein